MDIMIFYNIQTLLDLKDQVWFYRNFEKGMVTERVKTT